MRIIKLFEEFNNSDIDTICKKYNITNYTINDDGSIDVDGNVFLSNRGLTKIPLKFNEVSSIFCCNNNQLTSLEGCPKYVGGYFDCSSNKLKTLEGGPKEVISNFLCFNNKLTSFEGTPNYVGIEFRCEGNPVVKLWELFKNLQHIELFNDLDIVREDKTIILQRLNEFLDMIGKPKVTEVKGYKCV